MKRHSTETDLCTVKSTEICMSVLCSNFNELIRTSTNTRCIANRHTEVHTEEIHPEEVQTEEVHTEGGTHRRRYTQEVHTEGGKQRRR